MISHRQIDGYFASRQSFLVTLFCLFSLPVYVDLPLVYYVHQGEFPLSGSYARVPLLYFTMG